MNVITLHVLHSEPSNDFGELRIVAPGLDRDARLVVWEGLPPPPISDYPGIAPVVFQGDLDGHRAYAEHMPRGLRLTDVKVPSTLVPAVALAILQALNSLHARGQLHGHLVPERVVLGENGVVMLIGRGRRGGTAQHDMCDAFAVIEWLGLELDEKTFAMQLVPLINEFDQEALATLVHAHQPAHQPVIEQLLLHVGPSADDSLDEVVPYLGPDYSDEVGLLDRWAVTTSAHGTEHTADLTDANLGAGGHGTFQLSVTLWTRLAAPQEHAAAQGRFDDIEGQPSRGLRALLAEEPLEGLPSMIDGDVGSFLFIEQADDIDRVDTFGLDDDGTAPSLGDDEDGDTAIYDLRRVELAAALHRTENRSSVASLEARVQDAEKRIADAEARAQVAEARGPGASKGSSKNKPSFIAGFFRVEVFVAATLAGLGVWLLLHFLR